MITFLGRLLKVNRFEDMKIPLAIVATDLAKGKPVRSTPRAMSWRHPRQLFVSRSVPSHAISRTDSGGRLRKHGSARCAAAAQMGWIA